MSCIYRPPPVTVNTVPNSSVPHLLVCVCVCVCVCRYMGWTLKLCTRCVRTALKTSGSSWSAAVRSATDTQTVAPLSMLSGSYAASASYMYMYVWCSTSSVLTDRILTFNPCSPWEACVGCSTELLGRLTYSMARQM